MSNRGLSKLYDAIDTQKYKTALKIANQLLQKTPTWDMVRAMKALVLVRMGEIDEGSKLCRTVAATKPTDEQVISMLAHVYKESSDLSSVTDLYDSAWSKEPGNVDFARGLFSSYVRQGEHNKQQMTAMKMYKTFGDETYLMWAVASILSQVEFGGEKRLLLLAETLMRRSALLQAPKIETEVCELMLLVLRKQGEPKLKVLLESISDGGLLCGAMKPEHDRLTMIAECQMEMHYYAEALEVFKSLLMHNPDDWSYLCGFLNCCYKIYGDSNIARQFLHQLQQNEKKKSSKIKRGPFLAELELEYMFIHGVQPEPECETEADVAMPVHTQVTTGGQDAESQPVTLLIHAYFEQFGNKPCCFDDLKKYLFLLNSEEARIRSCQEMAKNVLPVEQWEPRSWASESAAWKYTCLCRIALTLRVHNILCLGSLAGGIGATLAAATALNNTYHRSLETLQDGMEDTELRVSDRLLILIVTLLYELYREQDDDMRFLVEGISILRSGLKRSPYNFKLKVLLFLLYGELGAFEPAWALWKSLHVRHIQMDTLVFLSLPSTVNYGFYDETLELCRDSAKLYRDNERDVPAQIMNAYKHHYGKVLDFIEFQRKLRFSAERVRTKTQMVLTEIVVEKTGKPNAACSILKGNSSRARVHEFDKTWLPHDDAAFSHLEYNSDLTILDFLDASKLGESTRRQVDPKTDSMRKRLRVQCILPHLLLHSLDDEATGVFALESHIILLAAVCHEMVAPIYTATEESGTDDTEWYPAVRASLCQSFESAGHATVLSMFQVALFFEKLFAGEVAAEVPLAQFKILRVLPLYECTHIDEMAKGKITADLLQQISTAVQHFVVLPALLLQSWVTKLPSRKSKKSKSPQMAQARLSINTISTNTLLCISLLEGVLRTFTTAQATMQLGGERLARKLVAPSMNQEVWAQTIAQPIAPTHLELY
jgi:N-terminal acetyltransferase B complex non-catalytic subunit